MKSGKRFVIYDAVYFTFSTDKDNVLFQHHPQPVGLQVVSSNNHKGNNGTNFCFAQVTFQPICAKG